MPEENGGGCDGEHERAGSTEHELVLLAAGVADLAVAGLGRAVGGLRDLLSRADLGELAGAGRQEVRARGRLAVDRLASGPPARLEVLARRVVAARDTSSRS